MSGFVVGFLISNLPLRFSAFILKSSIMPFPGLSRTMNTSSPEVLVQQQTDVLTMSYKHTHTHTHTYTHTHTNTLTQTHTNAHARTRKHTGAKTLQPLEPWLLKEAMKGLRLSLVRLMPPLLSCVSPWPHTPAAGGILCSCWSWDVPPAPCQPGSCTQGTHRHAPSSPLWRKHHYQASSLLGSNKLMLLLAISRSYCLAINTEAECMSDTFIKDILQFTYDMCCSLNKH